MSQKNTSQMSTMIDNEIEEWSSNIEFQDRYYPESWEDNGVLLSSNDLMTPRSCREDKDKSSNLLVLPLSINPGTNMDSVANPEDKDSSKIIRPTPISPSTSSMDAFAATTSSSTNTALHPSSSSSSLSTDSSDDVVLTADHIRETSFMLMGIKIEYADFTDGEAELEEHEKLGRYRCREPSLLRWSQTYWENY